MNAQALRPPLPLEGAPELPGDAALGQLRAEAFEARRGLDGRPTTFDPEEVYVLALKRPADGKLALRTGEASVFGSVGGELMQNQGKARRRVGAHGNAGSFDDNPVLARLPVGFEDCLDQAGELDIG